MRKLIYLVLMACLSVSFLASQTGGKAQADKERDKGKDSARDAGKVEKPEEAPVAKKESEKAIGLMFNVVGIGQFLDEYSDGYQAGVGLVFRQSAQWDLRALIDINMSAVEGADIVTQLGGSVSYEKRLKTSAGISPYVGAMAGLRLLLADESQADFYFGGNLGVEYTLKRGLSLFGEYAILGLWDDSGFTFGFGSGGGVRFGVIILF